MHRPCATRSAVKVARSGASASNEVGTARMARLTRMPRRAVDPLAEKGDGEARNRHAHGAGVYGEAHGGGGNPVGLRERRQDRLRGEKVDEGEKRREPDD